MFTDWAYVDYHTFNIKIFKDGKSVRTLELNISQEVPERCILNDGVMLTTSSSTDGVTLLCDAQENGDLKVIPLGDGYNSKFTISYSTYAFDEYVD